MQPKFDGYQEGVGAELVCPKCGNTDLHHGRIEIFERPEDDRKGLHIAVAASGVSVDTDLTGNPSTRRHGFAVYFSCEHCDAKSRLTLAQHKGKTYVDFLA